MQKVQIVAKFFVAQIDQKRKGTNRGKVFRSKNRQKIDQNSNKIAKKRNKAPKGAQERHKAGANHSFPDFWAEKSRSWDALGPPRAAPGHPKRGPAHQNASPKQFFMNFSHLFSTSLFASIFGALKSATICTEPLNIRVSPRREHDFHKIE